MMTALLLREGARGVCRMMDGVEVKQQCCGKVKHVGN